MRIEFDPAKDAANRQKHGIPLSVGALVIANAIEKVEDTRIDYGDERYVALGYVEHRLLACVFTSREQVVRIISVRAASQRERIRYG